MKEVVIFALQFSLLICSLNSLVDNEDKNETKKFLIFSFKRNLSISDSVEPKEFFRIMFYNQIYINITVGSQKQNIPFYLYFQKYPLVLQPSKIKSSSEVKGIYDQTLSQSYKSLEGETQFKKGDLIKGILSEDIFYFNSTSANTNFYLSVENFCDSHITEGGKIGFRYNNDYQESKQSNFIRKLKQLNIISGYDVSIMYDSTDINEDTGKIFMGALPHEIDNKKYDKSDYKSMYSSFYGQWEIYTQKISLGNKTFDMNKETYFFPEFGFISGTNHFFNALNKEKTWYEQFNNKKCFSYEFQIPDFGNNEDVPLFIYSFIGYYCEKDVNVNDIFKENITNITFSAPSGFNYDFILNNRELWIEKNGYKYFLILKAHEQNDFWILGKPFFKKFHMNFNIDSKRMGVYTKVNYDYKEPEKDDIDDKNNNTVLFICIISVLVVLVGVLLFVLIRVYIYKPRKKRANELLDDNFEYKEQTNNGEEENKIIPSEENKN